MSGLLSGIWGILKEQTNSNYSVKYRSMFFVDEMDNLIGQWSDEVTILVEG